MLKEATGTAMFEDVLAEVSRGRSSKKKMAKGRIFFLQGVTVILRTCGVVDKEVREGMSHGANGDSGKEAGACEERQAHLTQTQKQPLEIGYLMEKVCSKTNLQAALKRVVANKGAAGIDRMTVGELGPWLKDNEEELVRQLVNDGYKPSPVRRVTIPKPGGKQRELGIPTAKDRMIQQAMLQVLTPLFEPMFSESSYGFRPNKSAHQAILKAKEYVEEGREIVVDIDLEKFFDMVNHDKLMARVVRVIQDKRVIRLVRKYLQAGVMINGVRITKEDGTAQGGPLSPLLANIVLHDLDMELEKRGHKFCRYADDCNIYVWSMEAGKRVMTSIANFLEKKLKLKVNREKSMVGPSIYVQNIGIHYTEQWYAGNCQTKLGPNQG